MSNGLPISARGCDGLVRALDGATIRGIGLPTPATNPDMRSSQNQHWMLDIQIHLEIIFYRNPWDANCMSQLNGAFSEKYTGCIFLLVPPLKSLSASWKVSDT